MLISFNRSFGIVEARNSQYTYQFSHWARGYRIDLCSAANIEATRTFDGELHESQIQVVGLLPLSSDGECVFTSKLDYCKGRIAPGKVVVEFSDETIADHILMLSTLIVLDTM